MKFNKLFNLKEIKMYLIFIFLFGINNCLTLKVNKEKDELPIILNKKLNQRKNIKNVFLIKEKSSQLRAWSHFGNQIKDDNYYSTNIDLKIMELKNHKENYLIVHDIKFENFFWMFIPLLYGEKNEIEIEVELK